MLSRTLLICYRVYFQIVLDDYQVKFDAPFTLSTFPYRIHLQIASPTNLAQSGGTKGLSCFMWIEAGAIRYKLSNVQLFESAMRLSFSKPQINLTWLFV